MFASLENLQDVHAAILGVCTALALGVFCVILRSIALFGTATLSTGRYTRRRIAEVVWALVPIAIVVAAAMPAMQPLMSGEHFFLTESDAPIVWHVP